MEEKVGSVFKYFRKPKVAAVKIESGEVKIGDKLRFKGEHTDFVQEVKSMQIDMEEVDEVAAGDDVGIKVDQRVRPNDEVFLAE